MSEQTRETRPLLPPFPVSSPKRHVGPSREREIGDSFNLVVQFSAVAWKRTSSARARMRAGVHIRARHVHLIFSLARVTAYFVF